MTPSSPTQGSCGLTLNEAVERLRAVVAECGIPIAVRVGWHSHRQEPAPVITYLGVRKGTADVETRRYGYRAFWLLGEMGWRPGKKRACFDCWLDRLPAEQCEHEAVWV